MRKARFTIEGAPRTKKNSSTLVFPGKSYENWLQTVIAWVQCGMPDSDEQLKPPRMPYAKILPSEAYRKWHQHAMTQSPILRTLVRDQGVDVPIKGPVSIKALFYREKKTGDTQGYIDGLADFLQSSKADKHGRTIRNGAGIIDDDAQIEDWDGTRRSKDASRPRIEVEITILSEQQISLPLLASVDVSANDPLEIFT